MNKIHWDKPLRHAASKYPVRYLTKLVGNSQPHVVVIEGSAVFHALTQVDEYGRSSPGGLAIVENIPPPKIKIPYVIAKLGKLSPRLYDESEIVHIKANRSGMWTILSEGVLEVEDHHA